jgi:predicted nucleic acid-binding protein
MGGDRVQAVMTGVSGVHDNWFDASVLIKLYVKEEKSEVVRDYWNHQTNKFTTSICLYETFRLLKIKRNKLGNTDYLNATLDLCSWFAEVVSKNSSEPNFLSAKVFFKAHQVSERHGLDLSDALQLLSMKAGFGAVAHGQSRPLLISADKRLAKAARTENLRVWEVLKEPRP